jgi:hypothetical protein
VTSLPPRSLWSSGRAVFLTSLALAVLLAVRLAPRLWAGSGLSSPATVTALGSARPPEGSASDRRGARPPTFENCQIEIERLSSEIDRLEGVVARSRPPFQVYSSSPINGTLATAVREQLKRFFSARPGRYASATVECHGDACLISGPTALLPELLTDEWFRARFIGANPGGNDLYIKLAATPARDIGAVLDTIVDGVKEQAPRQCPSAPPRTAEYRIRLREPLTGGRHQLLVDTEGVNPQLEQCVVELMQEIFARADLAGLAGREATWIQRL